MGDTKLVTCPETGHLEELELEATPLGLVVVKCSRYAGEELTCPRECTRRMDKRDRCACANQPRVLVLVDRLEDDAARIASRLADVLLAQGVIVEVASVAARAPLADYDAVILGGGVRVGRLAPGLAGYLHDHADELRARPAFLFTVGGRVTHPVGWRPASMATFLGDSPFENADVRAFARAVTQIVDEN